MGCIEKKIRDTCMQILKFTNLKVKETKKRMGERAQ